MILVPPLGAYGELLYVQDHADIPYAAPLYFTDIKVSMSTDGEEVRKC